MPKQAAAGYTLIELILVMGLLTIIMAIGVPLYASLDKSNQLNTTASLLAQDLYQAQTNSRSGANDSSWGVAIADGKIILFSGANYASRDASYDISQTIPGGITSDGDSQIVYSRLYGLPVTTASFSLTNGQQTSNVVVNSKGTVEY